MGDESPHEVDAPLSLSRVHSHGEKCPGNLCSCLILAFFKNRRTRRTDEAQFLFHDPCDTCSSFSEREPLCDFCSHLRLRHLIICLRIELTDVEISLDYYHKDRDSGVSGVITTKGCAFCELMAKAIGAYFEISGENEEARRPQTSSLSLYLGNFQRELFLLGHLPGGEIGGKINLHYSRIATPSISTSPKCIIPNLVDWYRIQGWLSHCNQEHSCKRSGHSGVPEGFRLIDIENRCVTSEFGQDAKLGVDIKFAALSYVWGESNVSRDNALLNSNESEFGTDGGMKEGKVPQAIEDAITICKRLKQRYLWVDRFCIIQNNKDGREKQRQIDAMGDIYSSAEFTIIHASGKGIQCPIPGVSRERKVRQFGSVIAGLEITITYPDFKTFLKNSKWNTRGWTYQEAILSPRKLVFTSLEVWFECNNSDNSYEREDQYSTQRTSPFADWGNRMTQFRMNTFSSSGILNFTNFAHHLESYTARSLTNQSDILNAFTGILASVYEGKRIFHGLPEYDFDQALLWYCKNNDRPTRWGESCPSWSWTSVSETVSAPPVNDFISGFMGTLVWWVYRGPDTGLTAIRPRNSLQLQKDQDDGPQIHLLFAWWKGCIEAPIPENLERQLENYSKYMDDPDLTREWPTLKKVWDDIKSAQKAGPEAFTDLRFGLRKEDQPLVDKLPSCALLTRAQTARFRVSRGQSDYCRSLQKLFIMDSNGERVGMIEGNITEPTLTESKLSQDPCEFMAISLSRNVAQPGRERDFPVPDYDGRLSYMHNRLFSGRNGGEDRRPVVNVLLIGRTEESWLAHRISVGWINLVDWCRAKREFKTIALE